MGKFEPKVENVAEEIYFGFFGSCHIEPFDEMGDFCVIVIK